MKRRASSSVKADARSWPPRSVGGFGEKNGLPLGEKAESARGRARRKTQKPPTPDRENATQKQPRKAQKKPPAENEHKRNPLPPQKSSKMDKLRGELDGLFGDTRIADLEAAISGSVDSATAFGWPGWSMPKWSFTRSGVRQSTSDVVTLIGSFLNPPVSVVGAPTAKYHRVKKVLYYGALLLLVIGFVIALRRLSRAWRERMGTANKPVSTYTVDLVVTEGKRDWIPTLSKAACAYVDPRNLPTASAAAAPSGGPAAPAAQVPPTGPTGPTRSIAWLNSVLICWYLDAASSHNENVGVARVVEALEVAFGRHKDTSKGTTTILLSEFETLLDSAVISIKNACSAKGDKGDYTGTYLANSGDRLIGAKGLCAALLVPKPTFDTQGRANIAHLSSEMKDVLNEATARVSALKGRNAFGRRGGVERRKRSAETRQGKCQYLVVCKKGAPRLCACNAAAVAEAGMLPLCNEHATDMSALHDKMRKIRETNRAETGDASASGSVGISEAEKEIERVTKELRGAALWDSSAAFGMNRLLAPAQLLAGNIIRRSSVGNAAGDATALAPLETTSADLPRVRTERSSSVAPYRTQRTEARMPKTNASLPPQVRSVPSRTAESTLPAQSPPGAVPQSDNDSDAFNRQMTIFPRNVREKRRGAVDDGYANEWQPAAFDATDADATDADATDADAAVGPSTDEETARLAAAQKLIDEMFRGNIARKSENIDRFRALLRSTRPNAPSAGVVRKLAWGIVAMRANRAKADSALILAGLANIVTLDRTLAAIDTALAIHDKAVCFLTRHTVHRILDLCLHIINEAEPGNDTPPNQEFDRLYEKLKSALVLAVEGIELDAAEFRGGMRKLIAVVNELLGHMNTGTMGRRPFVAHARQILDALEMLERCIILRSPTDDRDPEITPQTLFSILCGARATAMVHYTAEAWRNTLATPLDPIGALGGLKGLVSGEPAASEFGLSMLNAGFDSVSRGVSSVAERVSKGITGSTLGSGIGTLFALGDAKSAVEKCVSDLENRVMQLIEMVVGIHALFTTGVVSHETKTMLATVKFAAMSEADKESVKLAMAVTSGDAAPPANTAPAAPLVEGDPPNFGAPEWFTTFLEMVYANYDKMVEGVKKLIASLDMSKGGSSIVSVFGSIFTYVIKTLGDMMEFSGLKSAQDGLTSYNDLGDKSPESLMKWLSTQFGTRGSLAWEAVIKCRDWFNSDSGILGILKDPMSANGITKVMRDAAAQYKRIVQIVLAVLLSSRIAQLLWYFGDQGAFAGITETLRRRVPFASSYRV